MTTPTFTDAVASREGSQGVSGEGHSGAAAPAAPRLVAFGGWSRRRLSLELAVLAGWVAVAAWNAYLIASASRDVEPRVRWLHLAFDLGHTLAIGFAWSALAAVYRRLGPKFRPLGVIGGLALLLVVASFVLSDDLEGVVERLGGDPEGGVVTWACRAAFAAAVPIAIVAGRLLSRFRARVLGVALGVAAIVGNGMVLKSGYPGLHLLIAASAASILAASLVGLPLRWPTVRRRRWLTLTAWVAGATLSAWAVAAPVPSSVETEMQGRDTAFLTPWLRHTPTVESPADGDVPSTYAEWFVKRDPKAVLPPTPNRLLPRDGIVILVTIDSLRYELMEAKNRKHAPNLHAIRRESLFFTQLRSPGSDTRFSLGGFFTGRFYSMLEWTRPKAKRPTLEEDQGPRLPELLSNGGVKTSHFHTLPNMLTARIGLVRGFQEEFEVPQDDTVGFPAPVMVDAAIERLKRDSSGPLFIYMHLIEPHAPYHDHGKPARGNYQRYLREVEFADEQLGRLYRAVDELGLAKRTAFIVSADHGEGFGENGVYHHNKSVYDVVVHVPLLIRLPRVEPRTIDDFVSLMDVGPTILDLFHLPTPAFWMGQSLVPRILGKATENRRPIMMETRAESGIVFPDGVKAIVRRKGSEELYDLTKDPEEKRNLRESMGPEGDERIRLVRRFLEVHSSKAVRKAWNDD